MTNMTAIRNLTEGQLIDLGAIEPHLFLCTEGQCPECDSIRISMEFEYAEVDEIINHPAHLTLLATSQGTFSLPSGLEVPVLAREESII